MKRNKLLSNILVVVFIGLFAIYFVNNKQDFSSLKDLNPSLLVLVALGYLATIFMNGLFNKLIIKPFNKHISYFESFKVSLLSAIGNYFGPLLGGTGIRAVYLKKKVGLNYTDFVSTLYGFYIIVFFVTAFIGLLSLAMLRDQFGERGFILLLLFFSSVTLGLLTMVFNKKIPFIGNFIRRVLGKRSTSITQLAASWQKIMSQPKLIRSLVKIAFVNIGLFAAINYFEFLLIGMPLDIAPLLLYTCIGIFSILISLTPGALGIREAIYIFSGSVMGVSSSQILAVAVIDRTVQFLVMSAGWVITSVAARSIKSTQANSKISS